eukprot:scaffold51842_cov54-Phaeocystis_antarctica.AAC.1
MVLALNNFPVQFPSSRQNPFHSRFAVPWLALLRAVVVASTLARTLAGDPDSFTEDSSGSGSSSSTVTRRATLPVTRSAAETKCSRGSVGMPSSRRRGRLAHPGA